MNTLPDILTYHIIGFVSSNMGIFASLISRDFHSLYRKFYGDCKTSVLCCLHNPSTYRFSNLNIPIQRCITLAAFYGFLDTLKLLYYPDHYISEIISIKAAQGARINVLSWCFDKFFIMDSVVSEQAAAFGNLDTLKWLYDKKYHFDEKTFRSALYFGDNKVLDWLYSLNLFSENLWNNDIMDCIFTILIIKNKLDSLIWLKNHNFLIDKKNFHYSKFAADYGHISILQWLYSNQFSFDQDIVNYSIKHGIDVFLWCINHNFTYSVSNIIDLALEHNNIHVIKWCVDNDVIHDFHYLCESAIQINDVYIIDYLNDNKLFDINNHCNSIKNCNSTVLLWIINVFGVSTLIYNNVCQIHILELLLIHNIRISNDDIYLYISKEFTLFQSSYLLSYIQIHNIVDLDWNKKIFKDLSLVQYLTNDLVVQNNLDSLIWLFENGCPIHNSNIVKDACYFGNVIILDWCIKHNIHVDKYLCLSSKNMNIIRWFLSHHC